jgi:hypothetical protein
LPYMDEEHILGFEPYIKVFWLGIYESRIA